MAGFGAYGKIPALGDFFRIAVSPGFVNVWDDWLQGGILALRDSLGGRWQSCYLSAPIWRFSLSAGVAGPYPVVGVMMPSVDRVGRQFPLTLAAQIPDGGSSLKLHLAAGSVFVDLEEIALDTLDDAMTRDRLADRLGSLTLSAENDIGTPTITRDHGLWALTLIDAPPDPEKGVVAIASELVMQGLGKPCIWSADLDGKLRMLITEGLPTRAQMVALFDMEAPPWPVVRTEDVLV